MKISNYLMAGVAALFLMTSCGGDNTSSSTTENDSKTFNDSASLDEAKKVNSVEDGKSNSEQKTLKIKNAIEQLNNKEYDTDFEAAFSADQYVTLDEAEAWAKEDSNLKDLVDEFKEAEQADKEKKKEYLREKIEWAKDNGLEKMAEQAEIQLKNIK